MHTGRGITQKLRLYQLRECRDTRGNFKVVTLLSSMLLGTVHSYCHHHWLWLTRACSPQIVIWQKAGYRACYKSVKALYDCTLWLRSVVKVALQCYNDIHTFKKRSLSFLTMLLVVEFLCVWYNHLITFFHWATFEVHSTSSTRDTDSVLRQAFVQICRTTERDRRE